MRLMRRRHLKNRAQRNPIKNERRATFGSKRDPPKSEWDMIKLKKEHF